MEVRKMYRQPTIDMVRTGANITALRKDRKISVKVLQELMGFNTPQAIFKWQRGDSLPSLDNLVILADLFGVSISEIVVVKK